MAKNQFSDVEKRTLKSMFWRSGLVFSGFNMVKMEGNAFCTTMAPVVNELYKEPEEREKALKRHNGFFNTHSVPFAFIAGLTYALEREKIEKGTVDDDTIENIKVSLMGPTAGIGDAFFFNCLRIIAAGIAMGLAAQGNLLGPVIFLSVYGGFQLIARWYLMKAGYTMGTSFIDKVFSSGLLASLTKAASILGISMVGAMVAGMVNVKMAWTIHIGETSVVVLDVLNSVMPGILSIVLLFGLVALIKKGKKPITLVLAILAASVLLAMVGVF